MLSVRPAPLSGRESVVLARAVSSVRLRAMQHILSFFINNQMKIKFFVSKNSYLRQVCKHLFVKMNF